MVKDKGLDLSAVPSYHEFLIVWRGGLNDGIFRRVGGRYSGAADTSVELFVKEEIDHVA